jgi:hypothetical protein
LKWDSLAEIKLVLSSLFCACGGGVFQRYLYLYCILSVGVFIVILGYFSEASIDLVPVILGRRLGQMLILWREADCSRI